MFVLFRQNVQPAHTFEYGKKLPVVWLRGPVENIPSLLQPVAHALMQAKEEVRDLLEDFPNELLREKPAGDASTGFHLQHLSGVLDRLFTYAQGRQLDEEQLVHSNWKAIRSTRRSLRRN